jgi:peroxiredoxin Q/BCP
MTRLTVGDTIPDVNVPSTSGEEVSLKDFHGNKVVLYFYPKDATSGCTKQGQDFRDFFAKFKKRNTVILGVSRDTLSSHKRFKTNQEFPFDLLSDKEEKLCSAFGVIKNKKMYGKDVRGIERSTFLIDEKGKIIHEWRGVKVDGHVEEVLDTVSAV